MEPLRLNKRLSSDREDSPASKRTKIDDPDVKQRSRRLFALVTSTLSQFREDSTKERPLLEKRKSILQEQRERINREREEMRLERMRKIMERSKLELEAMEPFWNRQQKLRSNFLLTEALPKIRYLPAKHTPETEKKLAKLQEEERVQYQQRRQQRHENTAQVSIQLEPSTFEPPYSDEDDDSDSEKKRNTTSTSSASRSREEPTDAGRSSNRDRDVADDSERGVIDIDEEDAFSQE